MAITLRKWFKERQKYFSYAAAKSALRMFPRPYAKPGKRQDNLMSLIALAGLPGVGKTTRLIKALENAKHEGRETLLFLCSDSAELRSRPHVKSGGIMGCRTPKLNWQINHFVSTTEATQILSNLAPGTLAVFDEASWFGVDIVASWVAAAKNGIDVMLGSISELQAVEIEKMGCSVIRLTVPCMLCESDVAISSYACKMPDKVANVILICQACEQSIKINAHLANDARPLADIEQHFLQELKEMPPFPREKHAYQPIYRVPTSGWKYVREDTELRAKLMSDAYQEFYGDSLEQANNGEAISYIDLGCCTGYFGEYMAAQGFNAFGVDIDKKFIELANKVTAYRQSKVQYFQANFLKFIEEKANEQYDVTSSFATIQWVIAQSGHDEGLKCFDWLFKATKKMCVLELGYSSEDIYKDKLPFVIDKEWILKTMQERGNFDKIIFFDKKEHGLWRDLYVGFRHPQKSIAKVRLPLGADNEGGRQIGDTSGYYADGWISEKMSANILCEKPVKKITVTGTTAKFLKRKCKITLQVHGQRANIVVKPGKPFTLELAVNRQQGDVMHIELTANRYRIPQEAGLNEDERKLSFLLHTLGV